MFITLTNGKVYEIVDKDKTIFLRGDVTTIAQDQETESVDFPTIERFITNFLAAPHYKVVRRQDAKTPSKVIYGDEPFCTFIYRDVLRPTLTRSCDRPAVFTLPNERDTYCLEHAVAEGFVVENIH